MTAAQRTRPVLANRDARRLFLAAHGLLGRPGGSVRAADIVDCVTDLGFIQVDSINTVAQAHDHILWSRRPQASAGRLHRCAARERGLFEGWTHDAALIPSQFFKHWRHKHKFDRETLARRWDGWGRQGFQAEFDAVLERIARDGALTAGEIGGGAAQTSGGWWQWKPTKTALEYLWRTGELAICHRQGFTKVYDLTERVLPPEALNARSAEEETLDWSAHAAMERLAFATPSELAAFWDIFSKGRLAAWAKTPPRDWIEIDVESHDGSLRRALTRADWEARLAALPEPNARLRIMSPFDPALRDRARAERLFNFKYRIEVFVPEAKRAYGYYVFPILEGLSLTGRIDMKADRAADTLRVLGYWPETGIRLGAGRAARLASEIARIAKLARVTQVSIEERPTTALLRESRAFRDALGQRSEEAMTGETDAAKG